MDFGNFSRWVVPGQNYLSLASCSGLVEAPAIFWSAILGQYVLFASHHEGWASSVECAWTSTTLNGLWTEITFKTQTITVDGVQMPDNGVVVNLCN